MFNRTVKRRLNRLDHDVEEAARATASHDSKSLDTLRYFVLKLVAGIAAVALSLVSVVGIFSEPSTRVVLVVAAIGCVVVFEAVRRARSIGSRSALLFFSALIGVGALIAATIEPFQMGTLTGFLYLGLAVCVSATEHIKTAVIFATFALVLGLTAIVARSSVPIAAAAVFVSITVLAVFVVIRFRMIVSDSRDRAVADALTDPLTGLGNRRRMDLAATMLGQIAERSGQLIGCLVIDIDHFKQVNDQFGHDAGDDVLMSTASTITETVRRGDLVVRLGGDEFAVFTIVSSRSSLEVMGERIRRAVESSLARPAVTVSVGGAMAAAVTSDNVRDILSSSDRALYDAKQSGRNAVNFG